jgi:hypothetical protein
VHVTGSRLREFYTEAKIFRALSSGLNEVCNVHAARLHFGGGEQLKSRRTLLICPILCRRDRNVMYVVPVPARAARDRVTTPHTHSLTQPEI